MAFINNRSNIFKIKINKSKFDELYKKYEESFNIGASFKNVAILSKEENSTISKNIFKGHDVGIWNKGENNMMRTNKFLTPQSEKIKARANTPLVVNLNEPQFHLGHGDNIKRDKNMNQKQVNKEPTGFLKILKENLIKFIFLVVIFVVLVVFLGWEYTPKISTLIGDLIPPGKEIINNNIENKNTLSAKTIMESIKKYPPLRQTSAATDYENIKVSWKVTLTRGYESSGNNNEVTLIMRDTDGIIIVCKSDLNEYPQLKIIGENQTFNIVGKIEKVGLLQITLNNCKLSF